MSGELDAVAPESDSSASAVLSRDEKAFLKNQPRQWPLQAGRFLLQRWDEALLASIVVTIVLMAAWLLWPQPVAEVSLTSFSSSEAPGTLTNVVGFSAPAGANTDVSENGLLAPDSRVKATSKAHDGRAKKPAHPPVLNLNAASYGQLQLLPGIGPKMAQRIIDYRKTHGPFASVEGIMDISGIGPKKYEKLKPYLKI